MAFKHEGSKVLLTEGINDCHVILALCKHFKTPETFGLYECGSDEKAIKRLAALLASEERKEAIGIVVDADNPSLLAKWTAIKYRLNKESIELPESPQINGTIIPGNEIHPKIGIWLMPNNQDDGMLEHFCHQLAPEASIQYAAACVDNARSLGYASFIENHRQKAIVHTFLAWQDEPGMPLGQAITARNLDPDSTLGKSFADWLTNLFA